MIIREMCNSDTKWKCTCTQNINYSIIGKPCSEPYSLQISGYASRSTFWVFITENRISNTSVYFWITQLYSARLLNFFHDSVKIIDAKFFLLLWLSLKKMNLLKIDNTIQWSLRFKARTDIAMYNVVPTKSFFKTF